MSFEFRLPEYDAVKAAVKLCAGSRILDVGCGTGIVTGLLPGGCIATERFADALQGTLQRCPGVRAVQCEPYSLPFPSSHFDLVVCTKVIDHLQSAEARTQLIAEMNRVAKPSARLIITALHQSFRFDGFGLPPEGFSDGVFYHRYYLKEFCDQLATHWNIQNLWGIWTYLPKTYPIYTRLGQSVVYWERLVRKTRVSLRYGKILLAICSPRQKGSGSL